MSSVRARTSQFENKQQQEDKKKSSSKKKQVIEEDSSSSEDEGGFEFADLVRALTGGGDPSSPSSSSTAEAIEALRETFKILDSDGDGAITLPDLRSALNGFGGDDDDDEEASRPEDDELAEMIAAADDADGEGRISFENFVKVVDPKLAAKHFGARKK